LIFVLYGWRYWKRGECVLEAIETIETEGQEAEVAEYHIIMNPPFKGD
jgi:hypothetical protein